MSDDQGGERTRPLSFLPHRLVTLLLPATTHHITSLLKVLNLATCETDLTSAWNTLTCLHVGGHCLSFSWEEGVAKAERRGGQY